MNRKKKLMIGLIKEKELSFISLAVTSTGTNISGSYDGIVWHHLSTISSASLCSVAYSPTLNLYVALRSSSNIWYYSSDAITWNSFTGGFTVTGGSAVIKWIPDYNFFMTTNGFSSNNVWYSTNGTTWTLFRTLGANGAIGGQTYSPTLSMILAWQNTRMDYYNGSWNNYAYSNLGQFPVDVYWASGLNKFITIDRGGNIRESSNGTTWSGSTSITANTPNLTGRQLTHSSLFGLVLRARASFVDVTSNLTSWTSYSTSIAGCESVVWSDKCLKFIAVKTVGTGNYSGAYSSDGISWTSFSICSQTGVGTETDSQYFHILAL